MRTDIFKTNSNVKSILPVNICYPILKPDIYIYELKCKNPTQSNSLPGKLFQLPVLHVKTDETIYIGMYGED